MRTLVTGATGYVGSRLVASLLGEGHQVTVASRSPERLGDFGWIDDVTPVMLDAADPESISSAFVVAGPIDVVYYLVHGIGQPGYRDADNAAAANVAQAAKDAGVKRIVYLGGFVPEADQLSEHLTSRAEVAEALTIEGGPEVVWLGAAIIIGAGSTSFEMLRAVGDRFLLIPMPPWANNPLDPISIRDVLYYLVAAADSDAGSGRVLRHPRPRDHHLRRSAALLRTGVGEVAQRRAHARRVHGSGVAGRRVVRARSRMPLRPTWSSRSTIR